MRSGSYMKIYSEGISFVRFCLVASGLHLTFALPVLVIILLFHLTGMITAFFLITLFLLSSPILSWLCWLMAKGSNWVNTADAMKTAGGVQASYMAR